ncbi:MAG: SIR2 family protein [Proteobacteria bacterium]|nr:SIR2 family protein [Burkholderiales bacterium]
MVIPGELVERFATGNGSLFVDAGLSVGAGLPSWTELLAPLEKELDAVLGPVGYTGIAPYYEVAFSRRALIDKLRSQLRRQKLEPTDVHRALLALPPRRIFTTNFDNLIESAAHTAGVVCDRVLRNEHLSLIDESRLQVVKVHGDLDALETVVLTTDDYRDFISSRGGIADLLKVELQIKTVLFLGYSFNDQDLGVVLAQVSREGAVLPIPDTFGAPTCLARGAT